MLSAKPKLTAWQIILMTAKTIGIIGGGQLGRMSALAAARLGLNCVIYTPEPNSPASQVCNKTFVASYDDTAALEEFASHVDVITYEFENIPVDTINHLKTLTPVYPDSSILEISQDRIAEKSYLNAIGIPTARWAKVTDEVSLHAAMDEWNAQSCIIKTCRFGYDGKGQIRYHKDQKLDVAIQDLEGDLIAEELIDFSDELSIIIAQDQNGGKATYGPMENIHKNHILHKTIVPAPFSDDIASTAIDMAETLANNIRLVGVLTLELFLTKTGDLLANEIAPRTHNSGHWSIDACAVSQFENHIRTVAGLPAAPPHVICPSEMLNLIGDDITQIAPQFAHTEGACLHDYGKDTVKPGRKMGHITFLNPKKED